MLCNERCKQSKNVMNYMVANPSNHTTGIARCVDTPGLSCKSLNVKHENTVDTETLLLRGEQSIGVDPNPTPLMMSHVYNAAPATPLSDSLSLLGETTRLAKSCNGEKQITSRLETPHPIRYSERPYMNSTDMVGVNSRNLSKYGKK